MKYKKQIRLGPFTLNMNDQQWRLFLVAVAVFVCLIIIGLVSLIHNRPVRNNYITTRSEALGLPPFITDEMVFTLLQTQSSYGLPASTGLAQIIQESGFGSFGPHGESGQGLSELAYSYNNLFGIKYWEHSFRVNFKVGSVEMLTFEDEGENYDWRDYAFMTFGSFHDCIIFRSKMLQASPYAENVSPWLNANDGAYTSERANGFAEALTAAGWATHGIYDQQLIALMEQWDLYRFDNMSKADFLR